MNKIMILNIMQYMEFIQIFNQLINRMMCQLKEIHHLMSSDN